MRRVGLDRGQQRGELGLAGEAPALQHCCRRDDFVKTALPDDDCPPRGQGIEIGPAERPVKQLVIAPGNEGIVARRSQCLGQPLAISRRGKRAGRIARRQVPFIGGDERDVEHHRGLHRVDMRVDQSRQQHPCGMAAIDLHLAPAGPGLKLSQAVAQRHDRAIGHRDEPAGRPRRLHRHHLAGFEHFQFGIGRPGQPRAGKRRPGQQPQRRAAFHSHHCCSLPMQRGPGQCPGPQQSIPPRSA